MILAVSSAATIFSACGDSTAPEIPVETVIGTQGEILGVSVYTEENKSETQTTLYEITTKKQFFKKNDKTEKTKDAVSETVKTTDKNASESVSVAESKKMTIRNNSSGVTLVSRKPTESTSRARPTFPQKETTQKSSRVAQTFKNNEKTTKHVPVSYAANKTQPHTTKKNVVTTAKPTQPVTKAETKPVYDEKVSEKSEGINIVFKTDSVEKGSSASIMIQGEPGKKYSIDFYTSPTDTATLSSLEDMTADENGFVTWTFNVPMSCEPGNKKVVIKEKGSDNYAQTSINVR